MIRQLVLAGALSAFAINAAAQTAPSPRIDFLSRFDFYVGLEHLSSNEDRFVWDANWGGEADLIDYGVGRLIFLANYQTILGEEFRAFDPNQGNYILEGSLTARRGPIEVAGVFHHVSRHLSDRPKRGPIDWNMIGGRVEGRRAGGRVDLRGRADLRGVVQRSFVDYRWELQTEVNARVALRPRVGVIAGGVARVVGVDGSRGRGTQHGLRGEGGIRLDRRGAALDLFVAAERRIDPYQLEFSTATWLTSGFRISSR